MRDNSKATLRRAQKPGPSDYRLGTLYALGTAALLALQEPFSAVAARDLTSLDFMAFTQVALLLSVPFLTMRRETRLDFATILLDVRKWPKLIAVFLVGLAGLALYDVGLSSAHPIITAAVLNLSPFWAALVAAVVSRRSIPISPLAFFGCFSVAFLGAMAIAWSQIDVESRVLAQDVIDSLMHSRWIYAVPMPVFFALSGTLVYEWFSDFDESAIIAANFVVSSLLVIPVAIATSDFGRHWQVSEHTALAVALLLLGTLAASAAGRVFYQTALTATRNDNGYVTMFFLLIPCLSALISFPLSHWIADVRFIARPAFFVGMGLIMTPLLLFSLLSNRGLMSRPKEPLVVELASD